MDAVSAYVGVVSRVEGGDDPRAMDARAAGRTTREHLSGRLYAGYAIPGAYYVEALSRRGPVLRRSSTTVFAKVDVLATPTIRTCLPTLADTDIDNGPPGTETRFMAVSANTRPFNYLGLPAISVPCGFDPNGLPIGLQTRRRGRSRRRGCCGWPTPISATPTGTVAARRC